MILLGATAAAVHAHGVVACELRKVGKPGVEVQRRPAKAVEVERRYERRGPVVTPVFSRRLILQ